MGVGGRGRESGDRYRGESSVPHSQAGPWTGRMQWQGLGGALQDRYSGSSVLPTLSLPADQPVRPPLELRDKSLRAGAWAPSSLTLCPAGALSLGRGKGYMHLARSRKKGDTHQTQ